MSNNNRKRTNPATTPKPKVEEEKTISLDEITEEVIDDKIDPVVPIEPVDTEKDDLKAQIALLQKQLAEKRTDVIVKNADDVMVTVMFTGTNGGNNRDVIEYTGGTATFTKFGDKHTIPLRVFEQSFMQHPLVRRFFEVGLLIVTDAPQSAIDAFDVPIGDVYLTAQEFKRITKMDASEIVALYKRVVEPQKRLILTEISTAFEKDSKVISKEYLEALNDATKSSNNYEGLLKKLLLDYDREHAGTY